jgi:hypothetical protein
MTKKKHEKPLHLDMSFDEALRRVAQADPRELKRPKKPKRPKSKRKSPGRGGKAPPPSLPD